MACSWGAAATGNALLGLSAADGDGVVVCDNKTRELLAPLPVLSAKSTPARLHHPFVAHLHFGARCSRLGDDGLPGVCW
jgi:hypothetical protein